MLYNITHNYVNALFCLFVLTSLFQLKALLPQMNIRIHNTYPQKALDLVKEGPLMWEHNEIRVYIAYIGTYRDAKL